MKDDWVTRLLIPVPSAPARVSPSGDITGPVRLSESLKYVALELLYGLMAEELDSDVLFELAWIKRYRSPSMVARQSLSDEGIEKLVEILTRRHSVPTVGFWRRYAA